MSSMGGMPMPGGWTMSMAWMRMPGQTWSAATASFVAMWVVMMAAMMLPSFAPVLWHYHLSLGTSSRPVRVRLTTIVGLAYFFVWTLLGLAIFPVGVAVAALEMDHPALARAVPLTAGIIVLLAGALQLTKWKAHHLTCCREVPGPESLLPAHSTAACKLGLQFGLHCCLSCANLTAILLVVGVMDVRAMLLVTAGITAERLAPSRERVVQAIGSLVLGAGLSLIARAVSP